VIPAFLNPLDKNLYGMLAPAIRMKTKNADD